MTNSSKQEWIKNVIFFFEYFAYGFLVIYIFWTLGNRVENTLYRLFLKTPGAVFPLELPEYIHECFFYTFNYFLTMICIGDWQKNRYIAGVILLIVFGFINLSFGHSLTGFQNLLRLTIYPLAIILGLLVNLKLINRFTPKILPSLLDVFGIAIATIVICTTLLTSNKTVYGSLNFDFVQYIVFGFSIFYWLSLSTIKESYPDIVIKRKTNVILMYTLYFAIVFIMFLFSKI